MVFQKGKSGNPAGRPRSPEAVQRVKDLAKDEAIKALSAVLLMDDAGLERIEASPTSTNAMRMAASLMRKTIEFGCPIRSQFIFNYIVGKPEPYTIKGNDEGDKVVVFETQLAAGVIRSTRTEQTLEIDQLIDDAMEQVCPKIGSDSE